MSTSPASRQPSGIPAGGQFAPEIRTEPTTALTRDGREVPDGPVLLRTFDIDGTFGPLVGYDDGRRWNGFACPWLTEESLQVVKAATREWAEVSADVEWLDDAPDGVWRLRTGDGEPPVEARGRPRRRPALGDASPAGGLVLGGERHHTRRGRP